VPDPGGTPGAGPPGIPLPGVASATQPGSAHFQILPYIEQPGIFAGVSGWQTTPVKIFMCPARGRPMTTATSQLGFTVLTDYAQNSAPWGIGSGSDQTANGVSSNYPAWGTKMPLTLTAISDGTSNTIAFGEKGLPVDGYANV